MRRRGQSNDWRVSHPWGGGGYKGEEGGNGWMGEGKRRRVGGGGSHNDIWFLGRAGGYTLSWKLENYKIFEIS